MSMVVLGGAALAQTGAPVAPTPQVSIAIGTFACKVSACTYELGNGTADALAIALLDTGRFSLYERENMAQLTEENVLSSSNPTQGFQGADVLIFGAITQLDTSGSSGGLCVFGVCLGSRDSVVGADLRIVDAKTRRVIAATHVEGKSSSNAASLNIPGLSLNNGQTSGVQAALGDMLKNAVNQLTQRIPASYYRTDAAPLATSPAPAVTAPAQGATVAVAPTAVPAVVSTPAPSFGWVNQFFFPDNATRKKACGEGFASATAGAAATFPGHAELTSAEGRISIDTSYGNIFRACQNIGLKAQPLPDSVSQENFDVIIDTKDYSSAALAVAFDDSAGIELGRVSIFSTDRVNFCYGQPSSRCTIPFNASKLDNSTKNLIARADSIRFLFNFGKGIETLTFGRTRFIDLK